MSEVNKMKNWFDVQKVTHNVYAFSEPHHWEEVVSYVFETEDVLYLFDTGMGVASIRKEIEKKFDLRKKNIEVFLTHAHWDHIGSAHEFLEVHIFNSSFEIDLLCQGFASTQIAELEQEFFEEGYLSQKYGAPGNSNFKAFSSGCIIKKDSFSIHALHTPGHTPGSVCYWIPEEGYLFTGDTVYPAAQFLSLPESNVNSYKESIVKLEATVGKDIVTIFPGHNSTCEKYDLLNDHCRAVTGRCAPLSIESGSSSYGEHTEYKYKNFSLLYPKD